MTGEAEHLTEWKANQIVFPCHIRRHEGHQQQQQQQQLVTFVLYFGCGDNSVLSVQYSVLYSLTSKAVSVRLTFTDGGFLFG